MGALHNFFALWKKQSFRKKYYPSLSPVFSEKNLLGGDLTKKSFPCESQRTIDITFS
jgi:hypothetical protein